MTIGQIIKAHMKRLFSNKRVNFYLKNFLNLNIQLEFLLNQNFMN